MDLNCSVSGTDHLTSRSQQVRVVTETWFGRTAYCISCTSEHLTPTKPNTIAHDFLCTNCGQIYELKSSASAQRKRIVDGAYATMMRRIRENKAPSLVLLQYDRNMSSDNAPWTIKRLMAIHPIFLTDTVVEARNPLRATARRAGWQGCTLRLDRIPIDGRIEIIADSMPIDKRIVRRRFASAERLRTVSLELRGWTSLVLSIVRRLGTPTFELAQVYAKKQDLERVFPNNLNVEAKIRQQLQILRDLGFVQFNGRGNYTITS